MTENAIPHAGIDEALAAIMGEVSFIAKDARNAAQDYKYASEETIKTTLRAALVKHGVLFSLETYEPQVHTLKNQKRGEPETQTSIVTIQCEAEFTHVASGQTRKGRFVGSGSGRDDKGIYAAVTGAIKYVLTSRFLIPTGDDPEHERNEPAQSPRIAQVPRSPAPTAPRSGGNTPPAYTPSTGDAPPKGKRCPSCGQESVFKSKPEKGGGWYCWKKVDPIKCCGTKYTDSVWEIVKGDQPMKGNDAPANVSNDDLSNAF